MDELLAKLGDLVRAKALLRSAAGGISTAIGALLIVPLLVMVLPNSLSQDITRWLPSEAGSAILAPVTQSFEFSAWAGFGLFCAYTAILLGAGLILFNQRDS